MKKLLLVVVVLMLAGSASATPHSFDFSEQGYFEDQVIEGAIYGSATLTSETGDLRYTQYLGAGIGNGYVFSGDVYFDFSEAVSNLSFRGGDGGGDQDAFAVTLYEFGTNNLLGTWETPVFDLPNGPPEWYTLNIGIGNVGRAVFDPGNSGLLPGVVGFSGGLIITDFGFSTGAPAIPEPATMLLFGLGMAGIGIIRRKRG